MPSHDLTRSLLTLLQRQSIPVTAAQLRKGLPHPVHANDIAGTLMDLTSAGQACAFTLGKGTAYAVRPPLDMCAEALAKVIIALQKAVLPTKLKAAVPKALRPWFEEALARLIVQGRAYWVPRGKQRLVQARAVRPSDLLSATQHSTLSKLVTELNRRRRTPRSIDQLLAWFDEDSQGTPAPAPTLAQLREWYALDRATSSASMIEIPRTWERYQSSAQARDQQADPHTFRLAMARLYDDQQLELEPCERPQDLDREQRALLVPLAVGPAGYYWRPTPT